MTQLAKWLHECSLPLKLPDWHVMELYENVVMDEPDLVQQSETIGCQPFFVEAADAHRCRRPRLFWLKGLDVVESQELKLVGSQRVGEISFPMFQARSLPPSLQWNGSCERTVLSSLSLRSHSSHSHDLIPSSRSLQKRQAKSGAPTKL
jgi:hypothetical protein